VKSDIDIAQACTPRPIAEIAAPLGLADELIPYGSLMAKVPVSLLETYRDRPDGKLILVTAMTPGPAGEGKTTNTIGLSQALTRIGQKTMACIREPSLGPCMGVKGGAAGGGYSQVLPMEEINLHFTGDLHAVSTTHNLLSAVLDNHLHQRNEPLMDPRNVVWKRVMDMNDRSLRSILVGLEGGGTNGVMREDGFEITAASEIMAIWGLSKDLADLKERMGRVIVGYDTLKKPIFGRDLGVQGAMAALMKNAINPNLVQTIEGTPVFVHGGPFANIAHGCNTLIATRLARKLADFTVTEAGFGADLGAEKFCHIKCRTGGLTPSAAVLVVTRRAHGAHTIANVAKHVENLQHFGLPVVISINRFLDDTDEQIAVVQKECRELGVEAVVTDFREKGGAGGEEIAHKIVEVCQQPSRFRFLYELEQPLKEKVHILATKLYGADGADFSALATKQLKRIEELGYGNLPVCMAKTPASLSDDPSLAGRPSNFRVTVSSARVSAGAGFVVIYTGSIMTMPGLPKRPSAMSIDIDENGRISGLF